MNVSNDPLDEQFPFGDLNNVLTNSFNLAAFCVSILVIDLPCFITIYKSKLKIVLAEFYILFFSSISIVSFKLLGIAIAIESLFNSRDDGLVSCIIKYVAKIHVFWCYLIIHFYYSLFHLASLKSASHRFKRIHDIIHSSKTFFFYFFSLSIGFALLIIIYSVVFSNHIFMYSVKYGCLANKSNLSILTPFSFLGISIFTIVVYLTGIFLLIIWYRKQLKLKIAHKARIYRKNLVIFLKFFVFSCFSCLLAAFQNFLFSLAFFSNGNDTLTMRLVGALFNFSIFMHHIIFIFAHNVLREKFKYMFCR